MTLLITVLAAVFATVIWYGSERARTLKIGALCYMFWGAALMWMVDAVYEYAELRADFFTPSGADMLNDAFLGVAVVALALVVWTIIVLVKDPEHVVRERLSRNVK